MKETTDKYLATILEGYEKSLQGVSEFIEQNSQQLETARSQREEIVANIAELKELLGVTDEDTSEDTEESTLKLVETPADL